ncbi:hypothetical protein PAI11_37550 [Patulibacter medicamentivorans]|uniref:Uncharacterized protein n=1 Tax=Patulibacter medicamentivorans TaxID=1097667 RepID=H0EA81_9ACTN|nr:hypothetical protein [Patulibacter medicamentivorans]EHN09421.1 hypothetical protein PAI11_37550 [Patulibacter medicamentivorans]
MHTTYFVASGVPITPAGRPCAPGETVTGLHPEIAAPFVARGDLVAYPDPTPDPAPDPPAPADEDPAERLERPAAEQEGQEPAATPPPRKRPARTTKKD